MVRGLLGKKVGMSQVFDKSGVRTPVTILHVFEGKVVQIKDQAKDGYKAVQLGFEEATKKQAAKKPKAFVKRFGELPVQNYLKEFRVEDTQELTQGQVFDLSLFQVGEKIDVSGTSKGKGFQGVVKRHGFAGGPESHGHRFHRTTGSIGNRKFPGRVFKNKRMPGHMGAERVTVQNLSINGIDAEKKLLFVVGAVPGSSGSLVEIRKAAKTAV